MSVIIECNQVSRYFGGLRALDDVSFSVEEGEIVGLIGPNGAGKTTIFNVIAGLDKPTSGNVIFLGEKITGLRSSQICKRGLGRTFQLVQPFDGLTVSQNIMVGHFFGSPGNRRLSIGGIIALIGLESRKDDLVDSLSVAALKKVELGKALATNPVLLLLDEVASGINPSEQEDMINLIRRLRDELNITIVMVEHIMSTVMRLAKRIIVLNEGRILKIGTPKSIAKAKEVIKVYLGEEYVGGGM